MRDTWLQTIEAILDVLKYRKVSKMFMKTQTFRVYDPRIVVCQTIVDVPARALLVGAFARSSACVKLQPIVSSYLNNQVFAPLK